MHGTALIVCDTNNHVLRLVDVETGETSTFPLVGLAPPGLEPTVVEGATLAAESVVELVVVLAVPDGTRLDRSAGRPVLVDVRADPPDLLPDGPVTVRADLLPATVSIVTGTTATGTLLVHARAVVCDEAVGAGAACRLVERTYLVPTEVRSGGLDRLAVEPLLAGS